MWWSRAVLLVALLALGPTGCGFAPMYAKGGAQKVGVEAEMANIRIGPIKNRLGQQLRNALVQRITPQGEPADYKYTLLVVPTETAADLGYRRDSFATLGVLSVSAAITLQGDGVTYLAGTSSTEVSFDYLGPRYASVAMERDAEERALTQLADDIRNQVAAAITQYKANPSALRYRKASEVEFIGQPLRPAGSGGPVERR